MNIFAVETAEIGCDVKHCPIKIEIQEDKNFTHLNVRHDFVSNAHIYRLLK